MTFKSVAISGANGNLGKEILKSLLKSQQFSITILTRPGGGRKFNLSQAAAVHEVEYSNQQSLRDALSGIDVVVNAVGGPESIVVDNLLFDAAVEAGVKRFFPALYSLDGEHPAALILPERNPFLPSLLLSAKMARNESKIESTVVLTGSFLDMVLKSGFFGYNIKNCTAILYDGGEAVASGCTLPFIGACIVAAIEHPEMSKNRRLKISEVNYTGKDLLSAFERQMGKPWVVQNAVTDDLVKRGTELSKEGKDRMGSLWYKMKLNFDGSGASTWRDEDRFDLVPEINPPRKTLEEIVQSVL